MSPDPPRIVTNYYIPPQKKILVVPLFIVNFFYFCSTTYQQMSGTNLVDEDSGDWQGNWLDWLIDKFIHKLQNSAARIITGRTYDVSSDDILKELN
jgi:hypothetical protein